LKTPASSDVAPATALPQPASPAGEDTCARRFLLGLFSNLARLRESLTRIYGPAGLSEHKFAVLEALAAPDAASLLPSELARRIHITRSAMTELLDRLEARGWVQRARDPSDRRIIRVQLTAEGRRVTRAVSSHFQGVCRELLREADPRELCRLSSVCESLTRAGRTLERKVAIFRPNSP